MKYEDLSMLALPETIAQALLLLPGVLLHLGNNIGFVWECQHAHMSS